MSKVLYDQNTLATILLFEKVTRAKVKDCILHNGFVFVVAEGEIGKAIGKHGANVRKLEGLLKKKVKVVEFHSDVSVFVRNLISPLEAASISEEGGVVSIAGKDGISKGKLIGRDRKNLTFISDVVNRYFKMEEVRVV